MRTLTVLVAGGLLVAGCDGETAWRVHTADDGLAADAVTSVAVESDGTVWAGTHAGLSRFDGHEWASVDRPEEIDVGSRIDDLTVDPNGQVWVAMLERIVAFDGQKWEGAGDGPPGPATAVAATEGGHVLAAGSGGVWRGDDESGWERLRDSPHEVGSFAHDHDGTLWAAVDTVADGQALFEYDGREWKAHLTREHAGTAAEGTGGPVLPGRLVRDLTVDADGRLWVGTDQGLALRDGQDWEHVTRDNGLPHDGVRALAADPTGGVWVAVLAEGVSDPDHAVVHVDGEETTTYTTVDGLPDEWVDDLVVGDDGTVWAATQAGLAALEPRR